MTKILEGRHWRINPLQYVDNDWQKAKSDRTNQEETSSLNLKRPKNLLFDLRQSMTKPQWNKNQKNRRWEWLIPRCWTLTSKYRVLWRTLMGQDRFEHHVPIVRNSLCMLTALQCSKHWSYCKGENLWSTGFQLKPDGRLSTTFKSTGAFDPLRDWFKLARMN